MAGLRSGSKLTVATAMTEVLDGLSCTRDCHRSTVFYSIARPSSELARGWATPRYVSTTQDVDAVFAEQVVQARRAEQARECEHQELGPRARPIQLDDDRTIRTGSVGRVIYLTRALRAAVLAARKRGADGPTDVRKALGDNA